MDAQEIEAKFYLNNLPAMEERLVSMGAVCVAPRVLEVNLRFDTADGFLRRERRVLRLRKDSVARLTYKDPALSGETVSSRREIEFEVSDFDAAWALLQALGYEVSVLYEKYRTSYDWKDVHIVLDEMPFGHFCEIEGPDAKSIEEAANALNLRWDARCSESYLAIFERMRFQTGLKARDLTFKDLAGHMIHVEDLGLEPAD